VKQGQHRKELIALLLFSLIVGISFPIGAVAAKQVNFFFVMSFQYLVSMIIMFSIRKGRILDHKSMKPSFAFGVATFVAIAFNFAAYHFISPSLVAFLTSLGFIFTALIERVMFSQKAGMRLYAALVLSFMGLAFIVFSNGVDVSLTSDLVIGSALSLMASVCYGIQYLVGSRMTHKLDPIVSCFYTSIFICATSFIAFEILNPFTLPEITLEILPYLLYLGVGVSAVGRVLQFFAQKKLSATTTSIVFNAIPIFAAIAGLFFGDMLNSMQIVGAAIIMIAITEYAI
jgi:drug/metabolite transporter (DMT)-like permease